MRCSCIILYNEACGGDCVIAVCWSFVALGRMVIWGIGLGLWRGMTYDGATALTLHHVLELETYRNHNIVFVVVSWFCFLFILSGVEEKQHKVQREPSRKQMNPGRIMHLKGPWLHNTCSGERWCRKEALVSIWFIQLQRLQFQAATLDQSDWSETRPSGYHEDCYHSSTLGHSGLELSVRLPRRSPWPCRGDVQ